MSKTLRADITGLRAIAVLAVTLFHITHVFNSEGTAFSGGFLGVDIFFVISGYLMTMIIVSGLEKNSFSLWNFYKRRAKRICPALFAVILFTLFLCLVLFKPDPIHDTFKEGMAAFGFVSNFRFAKDLDYFDGGDFSHLFLHTWSLSVEWQFYIFYPLILICLKRLFGVRSLAPLMLLLTIVGVVVAVYWTNINARQSYFLLPSRACELLFGSLAYFYSIESIKSSIKNEAILLIFNKYLTPQVLEIVGVIVITSSFVIVDNRQGWPTVWLLLPMVGTWLCIAANNTKSLLRGIFFQKLGLWSYAIYLVHWPILVYAHALGLASYSFLWLIPIIILGWVLHVLVENKRNYGYKFTITYFAAAGVVYAVDISRLYDDFNNNPFSQYEALASSGITNHKTIQIGNSPEFILHGDSFSLELVKPLIARDVSFIFNNKEACYSIGNHVKNRILGKKGPEHEIGCNLLYAKTKQLASQIDSIPIVIVHNWPIYGDIENKHSVFNDMPFHIKNDINNTVSSDLFDSILVDDLNIIASDFVGRKVYIFGVKQKDTTRATGRGPNHQLVKSNIISSLHLQSEEHKTAEIEYFKVNNIIRDAISDIQKRRTLGEKLGDLVYVDPNVHCENEECQLFVNSVIPIYADGGHYSWAGAEKAVEHLLNTLGIKKGEERVDFSSVPDIDFKSKQTVLEYSPETGFKLPDSH